MDGTGEEVNEDEAPDPDVIPGMLEDALALLGNANAHLNSLRQRRFAEFLTPIGKRTLKEEIPTDKHLFPDQLHERIKSEHNHSTTSSANLLTDSTSQVVGPPSKNPSIASSNYAAQPSWRKRKWNYNSKVDNASPTGLSKRRFTKNSSKKS